MKKLIFGFAAILFVAITLDASAQTAKIYPIPQNTTWGNETAFENSASYTITGESDADVDAINLFKKNFNTTNGTVELIIGERGDAAVAEYESQIPAKAEGYYLEVTANKVVIAGNDGSGTYYGVQTFIQMASQPNVMCATITDYPSVPQRGLVEGYYGNPYSEADRMGLLEMFGEMKMNVYIYGPKDDAYHKSKWREEYPAELAQKITEYVKVAKANKIEFMWAIHPGEDIQWNDTDRANIVNKLKAMCALGVRSFAVFWDDLWGDDGTHGDEQAELMNYIAAELQKAYPDVKPLTICPTQYNRGWANSIYLPALGDIMNSDINVMWTGNSVVDMINYSDMTWINNQIKRKAYIWLNYPVSDYCINHLLMGPTYGNDLNIADMLSGFVSNPMEYAEASKVSLFSIADYTWNMPAYDSDASWEAAMKYLMPNNYEAFRFFCENNIDLGVNTHGLRRMDESPEFVKAKDIYNSKVTTDREAAYAAIAEQFYKLVNTANTLLTTDEAPALTNEIKPWLESMKYLGQKGVCIIEMNNALTEKNPEKFIDNYLKYNEYDDAQAALRSRDFAGSLKVATPVVGTVHIEPFIKDAIGTLVAEYKEVYDYRTDVFPAQVLENGTYHIKYNGKYLTNNNKATGAKPTFLTEQDNIRPQRQEWKISIDPSTNRYKIINLEDNRYLNENGSFTVSEATNPYEAIWHTYEITLLANGKFAIQNGGSAGTAFWTVSGTQIQKGNSTAMPDKYIFDIIPLGSTAKEPFIEQDEVYYIMDNDRYLTNNNVKGSGGTPTFKSVAEPTEAQEWKIAPDANGGKCYKITSNADGRYVNEYGVFGTNQYYSDWNTYLLTKMSDMWSIQWTQSAIKNGVSYIVVSGDRLEAKNVAKSDSYTVRIIRKGDDTSIGNIKSEDISFNISEDFITTDSNTESITIYTTDGQLIRHCTGNRLPLAGLKRGVLYIVKASSCDKNGISKLLLE
ncbi:MAG: beta-N-acetylglucosaminidase domain-containing protein [Bacteroidaceae bacterium]|nr:beta-N-acetylglucosaminidase domain-containing protein [Bacteroidaceae bacterium]